MLRLLLDGFDGDVDADFVADVGGVFERHPRLGHQCPGISCLVGCSSFIEWLKLRAWAKKNRFAAVFLSLKGARRISQRTCRWHQLPL